MIASALLALVLNCSIVGDIADAAKTRSIYLGGEFDKATGDVEELTLATEIMALEQLRNDMIVWRAVNCKEQGK